MSDLTDQNRELRSKLEPLIRGVRSKLKLVGSPEKAPLSLNPMIKMFKDIKPGSTAGVFSAFGSLAKASNAKKTISEMTAIQVAHFKPVNRGESTEGPFTIASLAMIALGFDQWDEIHEGMFSVPWVEMREDVIFSPDYVRPLIDLIKIRYPEAGEVIDFIIEMSN